MKNTQIRIETLSYHYESIMVNDAVERAIKSIEVTYRAYKHNHVLNGHVGTFRRRDLRSSAADSRSGWKNKSRIRNYIKKRLFNLGLRFKERRFFINY